MSSNGRTSTPNPPPASRDLMRVLRRQVGTAGGSGGLSLIVGESRDPNPDASFVDVRIGGADYTIPKLQSMGSISAGRPVYILVDSTFNTMLALGWVT
jgi:hypothetical protein